MGNQRDFGQRTGTGPDPTYIGDLPGEEPDAEEESSSWAASLGSQAAPRSNAGSAAYFQHRTDDGDAIEQWIVEHAPSPTTPEEFEQIAKVLKDVGAEAEARRQAARHATERAWQARQGQWIRRQQSNEFEGKTRLFLAAILVLSVLAVPVWGFFTRTPPGELAQYLAVFAGLAGSAVGYFFGRPTSTNDEPQRG